MRIAFDTNILVYAEGANGEQLRNLAWNVIARVRSETLVVPAQVLGELFNVLERKAKYSREAARKSMRRGYRVRYPAERSRSGRRS